MSPKNVIRLIVLSALAAVVAFALVSRRAQGQADIVPGKSKTAGRSNKPKPTPTPTRTTVPHPLTFLTYEYEVVTLDATGRVTERRQKQARYFSEDLGAGVALEMVEIPGEAL